MKHLKLLSLLLLVGLFIASCQRDEIEEDFRLENQSEIQLRSYNQEDCGFVDAFCEKRCKDFVKVFKTGRKGFKIFRLFDKLKALDPLLAKGFKETLLELQKNDHIFRKHPGHWPDLKNVTKAVGGKENLVFNVYKKVFDSGIINTLPTGVPVTFNITINGVHIRGTVIKLPNGTIRIDDFWIP